MSTRRHVHYWNYPWCVWSGSGRDEIVVARYCSCGAIQKATATKWRAASKTGDPDLVDQCKDRLRETR